MKKNVLLIAVLAALFAASAQAQRSPIQPTPEMKPLEVFAGIWTIESMLKESEQGPEYAETWTLQFRWIGQGEFAEIVHHWKTPKGTFKSAELLTFDSAKKHYLGAYVNPSGYRGTSTATMKDNVFTIGGTTWRNTCTFSADGKSMELKKERLTAGTWWVHGTGKGVKSSR